MLITRLAMCLVYIHVYVCMYCMYIKTTKHVYLRISNPYMLVSIHVYSYVYIED